MEKLKHPSTATANKYNHNNNCRFCGVENKENCSIFSGQSADNNLLNKISTVYPFVMYENDPLPQKICSKCIENVSLLYRDIQQVLRHQRTLMNLIRAEQPEHEYFRILKEIENSSKTTKGLIKASYNIDINQNTPIKLLTCPTSDTATSKPSIISDANIVTQKPENEKIVQNIQTKLELNGFTIKRIKIKQTDEILDEMVHCRYCNRQFSSQKELAQHQVCHLKLSVGKIFEKRLLPKNMRRGRLITMNNEKNIRCLNCWQVFKDNKNILQHWSCSDCYYYCFICGKEFPHSPKLLREHMPSVHGISFRSIMKQYIVNRSTPTTKNSLLQESTWRMPPHVMGSVKAAKLIASPCRKKKYYKQAKSSTKHDDGTFSCNICHKVFTNYRSSNSHMRIHNMPVVGVKKDVYSSIDETVLPGKTSATFQHRPPPPQLPTRYGANISNATHSSRPPYKIVTNNGPLRGIRTKIVQKRNDFIANSASSGLKIKTIEAMCTSPSSSSWSTEETTQKQYDWGTTGTDPLSSGSPNRMSNKSNKLRPDTNDDTESLTVIKTELEDNTDTDYNQWTCFICQDNFASSKEYEMHAMFVHNIN